MTYQPTEASFQDVEEDQGYKPSLKSFTDEQSSANNPLELELVKASNPKQKTGWKAVGEDAIELLRHSLKSGWGFAKRYPGNVKDFWSKMYEHPIDQSLHAIGQVGAGLAEGTKAVANIPHDILSDLGKRDVIPDWLKKYNDLPFTHIPEDTGIERALGLQPTNKSDELLRALPGIYGGARLAGKGFSQTKKAVSAPDLKQVIRDTQTKVNQANKESGKIFDYIEDTLKEKGKNVVPIDPELIDMAKSMLSNKFNNIINKARTGDYKALRKLQSSLGAKERKGLTSKNLADIDQAENIGVVRDAINESIQQHLDNNGFEELAKALAKNRKDYAQIQKTYFSTPELSKVFGKSQKVPQKPKTLLSQESTEMKRFMEANPELKKALEKVIAHDKKIKYTLAGLVLVGAGTTSGIISHVLGK